MEIGNLEVYGVIYKIENTVNGKVYIGQTVNGFDERYHNNVYKYTHNEYLKRSILKYGIDNFKITKIFDVAFSKNELDIKEKLYIRHYNSTNSNCGYNCDDGGANGIPNDITRLKMSKKRKGKLNPMYGRKGAHYGMRLSEEHRLKISKAHKGKPSPLKGRNIPDEVKRKMSESCKGKKPVICITTGKYFESVKEASIYYNVDNSSILKCCKGKLKSAGKTGNKVKLSWKFY